MHLKRISGVLLLLKTELLGWFYLSGAFWLEIIILKQKVLKWAIKGFTGVTEQMISFSKKLFGIIQSKGIGCNQEMLLKGHFFTWKLLLESQQRGMDFCTGFWLDMKSG